MDWSPRHLLERYNLELARGLLYWASEMRLTVHSHYKDIFKYLKLFKLMHEISPLPTGGYHIRLDGPISPFVKTTTRYGRKGENGKGKMEREFHSPLSPFHPPFSTYSGTC